MPQQRLCLLRRRLKILLFHQQGGKLLLFGQNAAGNRNPIFIQSLQHLCQRCAGVLFLLPFLLQRCDQQTSIEQEQNEENNIFYF